MAEEQKVIEHLVMAIVVLTVAIIFFPHTASDALSVKKDTVIFSKTLEIAQEQSYDDQKTLDLFKYYQKELYLCKNLTQNQYIWQFLTQEMELSDEAAAGIFGNMMVECGGRSFNLQPYVYSPGGYYYGLCQWGTSNHHRSINGGRLDEQLNYLASTIRGEMGEYGYSSFEGATDPESAAYYFARWYERCADPHGRGGCAREAYEQFGG